MNRYMQILKVKRPVDPNNFMVACGRPFDLTRVC